MKSLQVRCVIGWALSVGVVWFLAFMISNPDAPGFWLRVGWLTLLCTLVWGYWAAPTVAFNEGRTGGGVMGIFPVVGVMVHIYAVLSALFVLALASGEDGSVRTIHWILQVLLFFVVGIMILFFSAAARTGKVGQPHDAELSSAMQRACKLLEFEESKIFAICQAKRAAGNAPEKRLGESLKRLRETLQFGLLQTWKAERVSEFQSLLKECEALANDSSKLAPDSGAQVDPFIARVESLRNRVMLQK